MKTVLAIGLGSCLGGMARYLVSVLIQAQTKPGFPWGTFMVNVLGCLLIGAVFGLAERSIISQEWRLYLATGFLGGFTTFSAFSMEMIGLISNGRLLLAALYAFVSVVLGLSATFGGLMLGRLLGH